MRMDPKSGSASAGNSNEREGAEIVTGAEALTKFIALLQSCGFPGSIFPLPSLEEFGFVERTGFFWIKHSEGRHEHLFPMAKLLVVCMKDVSGRIQKDKISTLKGWKMKQVENKDLFLSATATEVWLDNPPSGKIHFKIARGSPKESFPVEVFAAGQ